MPVKSERKIRLFHRKSHFIRGISSGQDWIQWRNSLPHPVVGLAFVGRSNVGKSSLLNALFGAKTAHVSKTPGRTREINIFEFKLHEDQKFPFYAFDLPGYGFAEVGHKEKEKWEGLIQCFFESQVHQVLLINIQDARHPLSKTDQDFLDFLKFFNPPYTVVFNKIDKLKNQKEKHALQSIKIELLKELGGAQAVHYLSAESAQGLDQFEIWLEGHLTSHSAD